jgi:hypothetical protein
LRPWRICTSSFGVFAVNIFRLEFYAKLEVKNHFSYIINIVFPILYHKQPLFLEHPIIWEESKMLSLRPRTNLFPILMMVSLFTTLLIGQPSQPVQAAAPAQKQSSSAHGLSPASRRQVLGQIPHTGHVSQSAQNDVVTQDTTLVGSNTKTSDEFGYSSAISGNTLVVGALNEDGGSAGINGNQNNSSAIDSGAVYVFVNDGGGWTQQAYIKASNPDSLDYFGYSVAISGDTIVVGALGEASSASGVDGNQNNNSLPRSGAAYVFVRQGSTWTQQAYLKASNPDEYDDFGTTVSISGDTVVVGAELESSNAQGINGNQSNNSAGGSGAAYVFVRQDSTWTQQAYLKASNAALYDEFGYDVSISGDSIVVGANQENSCSSGVDGDQDQSKCSRIESGAAYVFVRSGTDWSQQAYLKASNPAVWVEFGRSVAISGDSIVVGSIGADGGSSGVNGNPGPNSVPGSGAAYAFFRSGTTWSQQAYLTSAQPVANDWFGSSVDISGDLIVVGIPFEDSSAEDSGGAYVFTRTGTTWSRKELIKAAQPLQYGLLGWAVSAADDMLLIGAPTRGLTDSSSVSGNGAKNTASISVTGIRSQNTFSPKDAAYVFLMPNPDLTVLGNNHVIQNGDTTPSSSDNTDFGSYFGGHNQLTFTIRNTGNVKLNLTGSPLIQITGAAADQFSMITNPASSLLPGKQTTFTILFNPSGSDGLKQATVEIHSNSTSNALYQFSIQGLYDAIQDPATILFIPIFKQ